MSILDIFRSKSKKKKSIQDKNEDNTQNEKNDKSIRRYHLEVQHLEDQGELEKIALNDSRWKIRQKATEKLQNQYLPDPLWFSLHPMKIKKPWFIKWQVKGDIKKLKLSELLE